jgi:oxygen-independent coproporphyrinogen-3 oxidase
MNEEQLAGAGGGIGLPEAEDSARGAGSGPPRHPIVRHLYVHIPFCHRICPYCSFHKHQPGGHDLDGFVDAVLGEIELETAPDSGFELALETVYFGGGTPSLLNARQIERLITGLRARSGIGASEWNLEANPRTFDLNKAKLWRQLGVTRVSLGVQAWDEGTLRVLGRDHSPAGALQAYEILRAAELPVVSLDLMFSIPGQALSTWREGLATTIGLQPDHVSTYNLTFEEDTEFLALHQKGGLSQTEDQNAECFEATMDLLGAAGYEHYEISNHAKPGMRCRHNQAYWRGADYLGLGPGAVSTVNGLRWRNAGDTRDYTARGTAGLPPQRTEERLTLEQLRLERVALELRTADGLEIRNLDDSPETRRVLSILVAEGLVAMPADDVRVRLTRAGRLIADDIAAALA